MKVVAAELGPARAVKERLASHLHAEPAVVGVGLMRRTGGWAVKVNLVAASSTLGLPPSLDGVEIEIDVTGQVVAR